MTQDRKDLKIQALREALRNRVAEITDSYEDRISDLRIELTEIAEQLQSATQRIAELEVQQVETDKTESRNDDLD